MVRSMSLVEAHADRASDVAARCVMAITPLTCRSYFAFGVLDARLTVYANAGDFDADHGASHRVG